MRILYVTPLWSGLSDLIIDGKVEASGMPAFIHPLRKLIELGNTVDFVIATSEKQIRANVQADWLKNSLFWFVCWSSRGIGQVSSVIRLFCRVKSVISTGNYDFVYGHGSHGVIANIVAERMRIPTAQRLYGTFLSQEVLTKNRFYTALRHPLEYLSYQWKKDFLLITDDGTHGDIVYQYLCRHNRFRFFFWHNGVESMSRNGEECDGNGMSLGTKFLLYPARIDPWKRQDLAVDLLKHLHDMGQTDVKLYFVGHMRNPAYWGRIEDKLARLKLTDAVAYLGPISKDQLYCAYRRTICVLSFYDISNLGNVFIEALDAGSIIVSLKDRSLDQIVESGKNGYLVEDMREAAVCIDYLIRNSAERSRIARAARDTAQKHFMTWNDRAMREIEQIRLASVINVRSHDRASIPDMK